MADKLRSRKFWLTFVVSVLVLFGEQLGIDVDPENVKYLVGLVASYVLGQGYVDGQKEKSAIALQVGKVQPEPQPAPQPTDAGEDDDTPDPDA